MGADSKIQWTHHTFNAWWGCVKVSPGCANCYAEAFDRRTHGTAKHTDAKGAVRQPHWGKDAPRRFFGDAHWREPLKWNREAEMAGERRRVFCASMADVFEDRPDLVEPRARLFALIDATPTLDWLLLSKRPENIARLLIGAADWGRENSSLDHIALREWGEGDGRPFPNVWLGTTVENQEQADRRIPLLLQVPAAVRFLSVEPLLGPVDLRWLGGSWTCPECGPCRKADADGCCTSCGKDASAEDPGIGWVIVGGESGPGARPMHPSWAVSVLEQCREAGVPAFFKQTGSHLARLHGYSDSKGGDLSELPPAWRVREFPEVRT